MESFYGGRQGAPFSIVKRFDAIRVEENDYIYKYFAYWETKLKYLSINNELVARDVYSHIPTPREFGIGEEATGQYESDYLAGKIYWKKIPIHNIPIGTIDGALNINEYTFSKSEYKEGMLNCFEQGTATLNEINYNEYCIIDCITNWPSETDRSSQIQDRLIDHGKIFKRNIDNTAEYIGKISGFNGISQGFKILTKIYDIQDLPHNSVTPEQYAKDTLHLSGLENDYKYCSILLEETDQTTQAIQYTVYGYDYAQEEWTIFGTLIIDNLAQMETNIQNLFLTTTTHDIKIRDLESEDEILQNQINTINSQLNILDSNVPIWVAHNRTYRGKLLLPNSSYSSDYNDLSDLIADIYNGDFSKIYVGDIINVPENSNIYNEDGWIILGINTEFSYINKNHVVVAPVKKTNNTFEYKLYANRPSTLGGGTLTVDKPTLSKGTLYNTYFNNNKQNNFRLDFSSFLVDYAYIYNQNFIDDLQLLLYNGGYVSNAYALVGTDYDTNNTSASDLANLFQTSSATDFVVPNRTQDGQFVGLTRNTFTTPIKIYRPTSNGMPNFVGVPKTVSSYSIFADLFTETEIFGTKQLSAGYYDCSYSDHQLPAFKLNPSLYKNIEKNSNFQGFWLKNYVGRQLDNNGNLNTTTVYFNYISDENTLACGGVTGGQSRGVIPKIILAENNN